MISPSPALVLLVFILLELWRINTKLATLDRVGNQLERVGDQLAEIETAADQVSTRIAERFPVQSFWMMTTEQRAQRRLDRQTMSPAQRARWLAQRQAQLRRIAAHYRRMRAHAAARVEP